MASTVPMGSLSQYRVVRTRNRAERKRRCAAVAQPSNIVVLRDGSPGSDATQTVSAQAESLIARFSVGANDKGQPAITEWIR